MNYDNSLVVTITVTCNLWAPYNGDHLFTCGAIYLPPHLFDINIAAGHVGHWTLNGHSLNISLQVVDFHISKEELSPRNSCPPRLTRRVTIIFCLHCKCLCTTLWNVRTVKLLTKITNDICEHFTKLRNAHKCRSWLTNQKCRGVGLETHVIGSTPNVTFNDTIAFYWIEWKFVHHFDWMYISFLDFDSSVCLKHKGTTIIMPVFNFVYD